MGQLSDMMNKDFDRRIDIAKKLGIPVHGKKMMKFQIAERSGDPNALKNLEAQTKKK